MSLTRLPINTLSGGVGRQAPTKRLTSEAENIDNCLVTLEKSVEKRPPLSRVEYYVNEGTPSGSSYLPLANLDPTAGLSYNTDNLYFHFLDIDGFNRYCIIINRAGYSFDPVVANDFKLNGVTIKLDNFLTVYRIEPTKWVKEVVDNTELVSNVSNTAGFNRGIFEYLTFGNKSAAGGVATSYKIANTTYSISPTSIKDTFSSMDLDVGLILWNKLVPLDYLPDNESNEYVVAASWVNSISLNEYIHSGDVINYKIAAKPSGSDPITENNLSSAFYWTNVRDDIQFIVSSETFEESEIGQNLENFGEIPQYPATEVQADVQDANGWRALRMLHHYYDNPRVLPKIEFTKTLAAPQSGTTTIHMADTSLITTGMYVRGAEGLDRVVQSIVPNVSIAVNGANFTSTTSVTLTIGKIDWLKDHFQLTSPLPQEDRDGAVNYFGFGKVYQARNPYLSFPAGFYRATRYGKNPYFERVRSEGPNSVFDHRRFPVIIYKDTAGDGKWRIKHMPLFPRRAGTAISNPGPKALERKETIQSMAIWKNRMWIATENTLIASRTNSYFNYWVDDVHNITESDPIDIQSSVGAYNKLSYIVPFQSVMFAASSGSVQFEVRGGDSGAGISPFNVELRPTSFFSTSKLVEPQKMGNQIFFMDAGRMYMYLSGSSFNDEFSTSMDVSTHCRGYLPSTFGAVCSNSATNSIFFVDGGQKNHIYTFTFRTNGDKVSQNAFARWILAGEDEVKAMKSYEKDLYIVSKRPAGPDVGDGNKLVVYLVSLEAVPLTTPMLDWLTEVTPASMVYVGGNTQQTVITLPHYDPDVNYAILTPAWGAQAYTAFLSNSLSINNSGNTTMQIPGNWTGFPVYVGRSYLMNIELSQQVQRTKATSGTSSDVVEGVLNLKRITFKHYNTGSYDVLVQRRGRPITSTTFFPTDINSLLSVENQLKVDLVGEHYSRLLSYSEATKINIQSAYPTPCNISNIEILGNFRSRNTSIE